MFHSSTVLQPNCFQNQCLEKYGQQEPDDKQPLGLMVPSLYPTPERKQSSIIFLKDWKSQFDPSA